MTQRMTGYGFSYVLGCIVNIAIVFPHSASAAVYQWTDSEGKIHFSDRKPAHHSDNRSNNDVDQQYQTRTFDGISTYEPVVPDIPDEQSERDQRNQDRLDAKKTQRLKQEKAAQHEAKKQDRCAQARYDYRFSEGRYRQSPGLEDVKKARRRIDKIKARIKKYCY